METIINVGDVYTPLPDQNYILPIFIYKIEELAGKFIYFIELNKLNTGAHYYSGETYIHSHYLFDQKLTDEQIIKSIIE